MDYLIQGETLTAIGNAIREKTGKSEMITPENMPAEISGISGGGESLKILHGSFIPSEDTKSYTIEHNLGKLPKIACFFISDKDLLEKANPTYRFDFMTDFFENGSVIDVANVSGRIDVSREAYYKYPENAFFSENTEQIITFGGDRPNDMYFKFKAGVEYQWFLVG